MHYETASAAHEAISVMLPLVNRGSDDSVQLNALLGSFDILKAHPDAAITTKLHCRLRMPDAGPLTLHAIAQVVWLHNAQLDDTALSAALQALQSASSENIGTINILNMGLTTSSKRHVRPWRLTS